ncbi:MAG: hypothetical protein HQL31_05250 [Planctomycetes bacterium]|nr:hypothetical protein [Planctomycetota bacterium]
MLTLTTDPTSYNLLRQALFLLEARVPRLDDAYALALMAGVDALSVEVLVRIAEVLAGKGEYGKAEVLLDRLDVDRVYAEDPGLKDINSRIGWVLYWRKKEYGKVIEWIEKDLCRTDRRSPLFNANKTVTDQSSLFTVSVPGTMNYYSINCRLSPAWRLNYAQVLAELGEWKNAEALVGGVYQRDINVRDGYARLGWVSYQGGDARGALPWLRKDYEQERLSPGWQIKLALVYGNLGDFKTAEVLIEHAYKKDNGLTNGFVQLGWCWAIAPLKNWAEAERLMLRDYETGRISFPWQSMLVNVWCVLGKVVDAQNLVEGVYAENPSAADMYAKLGWTYALSSKNYEFFLKMIEKDKLLKRHSESNVIYKIYYFACIGSIEKAWNLALDFCDKHPDKNYFFPTMGWLVFRSGNIIEACRILDYSFEKGCMSVGWYPSYSFALYSCGRLVDACKIIDKVISFQPDEKNVIIGFPLYPDHVVSSSSLREMLFCRDGGHK